MSNGQTWQSSTAIAQTGAGKGRCNETLKASKTKLILWIFFAFSNLYTRNRWISNFFGYQQCGRICWLSHSAAAAGDAARVLSSSLVAAITKPRRVLASTLNLPKLASV